jgi:hypothetical protein
MNSVWHTAYPDPDDADGEPLYAPRPTCPPFPPPLPGNGSVAAANARLEIITDRENFKAAEVGIKKAILHSIGEIAKELEHPTTGMSQVTCLEMVEHVTSTFNSVEIEDISEANRKIKAMQLVSLGGLRLHAAEMRKLFTYLELNHAAKSDVEQCMALGSSVTHFQDCFTAVQKYYAKHTLAQQNFAGMTKFIIQYLKKNISADSAMFAAQHSMNGLSLPGGTRLASDTNTFMARMQIMEDQMAAIALAGGAALPARTPLPAAVYVPLKNKYCYVHGKCEHHSTECKFMASGKPNPRTRLPYTTAMKGATSAATVAGGNPN